MTKSCARMLGILLLLTAPLSYANKYAVLVGVSEYPSNPKWNLDGPKEDVAQFRIALPRYGFDEQNIYVLADDVENAILPTKENILTGLRQVAQKSQQDDFVFLYFAGHGSQQPSNDTDISKLERDGLDEIFLPRDIGTWNGAVGSVDNALVDNEIAAQINIIRETGAFVWVVMDSCHSGGAATRGVTRMREVKMSELGIPVDQASSIKTRGTVTATSVFNDDDFGSKDGMGGYVAFYAAQSHQTTPEMKLPLYGANAKYKGLFTHSLLASLEQGQFNDYRSLANNILNQYRSQNWYGSTPLFEGGANLDKVPFELTENKVKRTQLLIDKDDMTLGWGTLHGLTENSLLAVYESPSSPDNEILGFVKVDLAMPLVSKVRKAKFESYSADFDIPETKNIVVQLHSNPLTFELNIHDATKMGFKESLANLNNIRWVKRSEAHYIIDYDKQLDRDQLYLYSTYDADDMGELLSRLESEPNPDIWRPALIPIAQKRMKLTPQKLANELKKTLLLLVRQRSLMSLISDGNTGSKTVLNVFKTEAEHRTVVSDEPKFRPGDSLEIDIQNAGDIAINATLLFVGADLSISVLFPTDGQNSKLLPNQKATIEIGINNSSIGKEAFILLTEKSTNSPPTSFEFLSQPGVVTRAVAEGGLAKQLKSLYSKTRGAELVKNGSEESWISAFHFETTK